MAQPTVGAGVGALLGASEGIRLGASEGIEEGAPVGVVVGEEVGVGEGLDVGVFVGGDDGIMVVGETNRVRLVRMLSSRNMNPSISVEISRTCWGRSYLKLRGVDIVFAWVLRVATGSTFDSECLSHTPKCKDRACEGDFHC
jgi:hypothetical protein